MNKHPSGLSWERWNWPFKTQAERKLVAAYFAKVKREDKRSMIDRLPAALMGMVAAICLHAPTPASAQTMQLDNRGGGKIVITLRECVILGKREPVLRKAYGYSKDGLYLSGCWGYIDNMVHIIWEDAGMIERRVYNPDGFVPMPEQ